MRAHVNFFCGGVVYFGFDFFGNITHKDFNGHGRAYYIAFSDYVYLGLLEYGVVIVERTGFMNSIAYIITNRDILRIADIWSDG